MGQYVAISVFKDKGGVYETGHTRVISKNSLVGQDGYINLKQIYDVNINVNTFPPKHVLLLITPEGERVYTDLTLEEWNDLVVAAGSAASGSVTQTKEYVIATAGAFPPGPTIVDTFLYNSLLHSLTISGVPVMTPEDIYDPLFSGTQGRLRLGDLPMGGVTLIDGDKVRVTLERPL